MKNPESYFHSESNGSAGVHPDAAMVPPGFFFNRKTEKIDWRQIAAVDLDRMTRDMDYRALQDNISNIAFCDIERELDSRYIDPNYIRLFKLAQLQIQYLLYSQEYLTESLSREAERNQAFEEELPRLRSQTDALKKECHRYKKMVRIQQMLMPSSHDLHHPCPQCDKKFISRDFLNSHLERRHRSFTGGNTSTGSSARAEVDDLRVKIRSLELELQQQQQQQREPGGGSEHGRLEAELAAYRQELSAQSQNEISALKNMIRELTERSLNSERALEELRVKQSQGRRSNLGDMVDEVDSALNKQKAQRELEEQNRRLQAELAREKALSKKMAERQRSEASRPAAGDARKEKETPLRSTPEVAPFNDMSVVSELESSDAGDELPASPFAKHKPEPEADREPEPQVVPPERAEEAAPKKSHHGAGDSEAVQLRRAAASNAGRPADDAVTPFQEPPSTPHTPQSPPKKEEVALHLQGSTELTEYTDEEDEEESDSAMVSREMKKTLAASGPLGGTGDHSVQSSWDISQLRSSRVMEKLKAEPELLQGFISELQKLLEERLAELGIDRAAKRLTTPVLNEKLSILRREREQMCAKHAHFATIRQQFVRQVDREAEEAMRGKRSMEERSAKSRSMPTATTYSSTPGAQRKSNGRRPPPRSPPPDMRAVTMPADRSPEMRPPPPLPRDISSSEESVSESESKDMPPLRGLVQHRPDPPSRSTSMPDADPDVRPSPRKPRQYKSLSASNGLARTDQPDSPMDSPPAWDTTDGRKLGLGASGGGGAVVTIPHSGDAVESADDSWDASDLDTLEKDIMRGGGGLVPYRAQALQQSMEQPRGQRPPGGVDVAPPPPPPAGPVAIDDEDDTFSISSINGEGSRPPSRKVSSDGGERGLFGGGGMRMSGSVGSSGNGYGGGPAGVRLSAAGTDLSNTFGTSQWGTTSKVVSTVNPGATQKSMATNKSSDVGGDEDFDSD